jgi:periplasmic copper chaperone A
MLTQFNSGLTRAISATALAFGLAALLTAPVHAHVTLEVNEAQANSTYKAVLRVGHGCKGEATNTLRVQIPDGVIAVKPMPKPGWALTTVSGAYGRTHDYFGTPMAEGALPDAHYDEFVFRARLTGDVANAGTLFFPTVQECATGAERWTEIPAKGADPHSLKSPAPDLKIVQAQHQGQGQHQGRVQHRGQAQAVAEQTYRLGDLVITAPWARATPGGAKVAGGFLKITNNGTEVDHLTGGSVAFAGRFEVHEMAVNDGIMRMRELEKGLEVRPGQTIELKPGSFHIMFMDLKQQLKQGEVLKGTLVFARAGKLDVEFKVGGIADKAGDEGGHKH